jgi:ribosomal protein S27E
MAVKVRCTGCEKVLTVPDQARGKAVKCPNCETRISVPAGGDEKPAKAAKKTAAKAAPDSESALLSIDLKQAEDTASRVCPKCGYDMTHYDEEITECSKCGHDMATGGLGEKARKRRMKGPDPDKFYAGLWGPNWSFVVKNQVLAWRTIAYALLFSLLMFGALFAYLYIAPWPPRIFFALCAIVSGMMIPGWLWFLDQEITRASLERKDKFKRINLDIFLCSALGVKTVIWHIVFVGPLLAIPAGIGWVMTEFGGMPQFVLPLIVGVCYLPVFSMLPIVIGHMLMPVQSPGWMFWKVVPAWFRVLKPALLWLMLVLFTHLPFLGCVGAIAAVYGPTLNQMAVTMDHNSAIARAKNEDERKGPKDKTKGQDPLIKEELAKIDYFPLIVPGVLWIVACLSLGFPALYCMRVNGQFVYYFRESLDMIVLAKEYKYVAKEKVDEEDIKPKTLQEVLIEAVVLLVILLVIGGVFGMVSGSMNGEPILLSILGGLIWGVRLAFFVGMSQLTSAAWKQHPGLGILVGLTPASIVISIVCAVVAFYAPSTFATLRIVVAIFGLLMLMGLIGSLIFVAKHWEEARGGCLLSSLAILTSLMLVILVLAGLLTFGTLLGMPADEAAGGQAAPQDPAGVMPDQGLPAGGPAAQIGVETHGATLVASRPIPLRHRLEAFRDGREAASERPHLLCG